MNVSRRRYMGGAVDVPFDKQYLTFEALEAGTFTFTIGASVTKTNLSNISYSLDGGSTWTTTQNVNNTSVEVTTPTVSVGDKVLWKGNGTVLATRYDKYCRFSSTGMFNIYGNMGSLIKGDEFASVTYTSAPAYVFAYLLGACAIVDACDLVLPYTSFNSIGCYAGLFNSCTLLRTAPVLLSTNVTQSCYDSMFKNCTSLVKAPDLMASSIAARSYINMFYDCTSLNYIKCLATTLLTNSTSNWLSGVSATGTFVKATSMSSWPSGVGGIPSGWTVIDA